MTSLPLGPDDAPVVLLVGKTIVAIDPDPGRPPSYYGEPGMYEPGEEPVLGPTYIYLRSKDRWVPLYMKNCFDIEESIWKAFRLELADARDQYEAALYGES